MKEDIMSVIKESAVTNSKIQALTVEVINSNGSERNRKFGELLQLIGPKLKFYIWKFFKNECDIEDVLGNTIEKLIINFERYKLKYKFTTWAFSIAKTEALQYKNKNFETSISYFGYNNPFNTDDYVAKGESNMFDYFEKDKECGNSEDSFIDEHFGEKKDTQEVYMMVIGMIRSMPDTIHKELLFDNKINNMKGVEIAQKYNMNENTVKTKLREAKSIVKSMVFNAHPELKHATIL